MTNVCCISISGVLQYLIYRTLVHSSADFSLFSFALPFRAVEKGMLSKNSHLCHDININFVSELLTRFVDMMARVQILAAGEVNSFGGVSAPSLSPAFVTEDDNHSAFAEWSVKGREWLEQFIAALQNASMLPLV